MLHLVSVSIDAICSYCIKEQESIAVGCVLPACQPYVIRCQGEGGGGKCPGLMSGGRGYPTYPMMHVMYIPLPPAAVDRVTDRHLWKHYLPQASFAGGNQRVSVGNSQNDRVVVLNELRVKAWLLRMENLLPRTTLNVFDEDTHTTHLHHV